MPIDFESAKIAIAIVLGVLAILGMLFGGIGKARRWASSFSNRKQFADLLEVPKETMVLLPVSSQSALWWHMGSLGEQPVMQIVGNLYATNISKHDVIVMGAKLRKPKAVGHTMAGAHNSNTYHQHHRIPQSGISDLHFEFYVQPPVSEKDEPLKADVAIIDQFGNEHWLNGLEFPYV